MERYRDIAGSSRNVSGWRRSRLLKAQGNALPSLDVCYLPKAVDLEPQFPPVKEQGRIGTCLANAMCECWEFLEHSPSAWKPFSRLFVYAVGRRHDGVPLLEDSGLDMHSTLEALKTTGCCYESTWPYSDDSAYTRIPSPSAFLEAADHKPLFGYYCPDLFSMMASLSQGFPVAFGMSLPENFESNEALRTGQVKIPATGEGYVGGHAMVAIGYNRQSANPDDWSIKVRNSWGADVGDRGNWHIPAWYWLHGVADDCLTIRKVQL